MKRTIRILMLALALSLALVACSSKDSGQASEEAVDQTSEEKTENKEAEEIAETEEEKTEELTEEKTEESDEKDKEEEPEGKGQEEEETDLAQEDAVDDFYDGSVPVEDLKAYNRPIILTMGTKSCKYCEEMKPFLKELNEEYKGKAIIKYVDLDKYPEYFKEFPIYGTPASVIIDAEGKPYSPSENFKAMAYQFSEEEGGDTVLTMIYGFISEDNMKALLGEMLY